ncbi:MAG: hypothetical protein ACK4VY_01075 [Brevundimonas sp.]
MDLQAQIIDAIRDELKRQASDSDSKLTIKDEAGSIELNGRVDLEGLAMAISGAVAGGP